MPTHQLDPTWPTKQEVAADLGVTLRSVERFTKAGKLTQRFRQNPGSADISIYDPEDVAKLKAERTRPEPPPRVLPPPNGHGAYVAGTGTLAVPHDVQHTATMLSLFEAFLGKAVSATSGTVSGPALFLTVDEAAAYSGLPVRELRHAIKTGELPARMTARQGWRIRRTDLDALTSAPPARPSSASTEYEPALPGLLDPPESEA